MGRRLVTVGGLAVSSLGGVLFLFLALRLARSGSGEADGAENGLYGVKAGSRYARNLFAFSILYLTLLFAALLAERAFGLAPLSPLLKGFS